MRKRQYRQSGMVEALAVTVALIGAMVLTTALPNRAWATVDCTKVTVGSTTDSDGDGLSDYYECPNQNAGIPLLTGITSNGLTSIQNSPNSPNIKDIFFAVIRAGLVPCTSSVTQNCSFLPTTGFDPSSSTLWSSLGVTAHLLSALPDNRTFTSVSQEKAVRVSEALDTNCTTTGCKDDAKGICNVGTPNQLDGCQIYTQRMLIHINSICDSVNPGGTAATICTGGTCTATDRQTVFKNYALHTIVHEVAHSLGGLTSVCNTNYGGCHYKTGAGYIMDQAVTYTAKNGICSFNISFSWNGTADPPAVKLK